MPVVERASSIPFSDLDAFDAAAGRRFDIPYYGRYGTATNFLVEERVARLEGAEKSYGLASGHAAIAAVMLALLSPGDHILLPATAYEPTKALASGLLHRLGVTCDFYPGRIGEGIAALCRPTTRLIWIEAPGSLTYEIPEISEIVRYAQAQRIVTAADNSWASACLFRPLEWGIDFSVVSATKYMSGHGDAIGGFISTSARHRKVMEDCITSLGAALSADSAYLIDRGLHTMAVRIRQQAETACGLGRILKRFPRISDVFSPALPWSPDHARWKTYFARGNGLLTFSLDDVSRERLNRFIKSLRRFSLGVSWGGVENLVWVRQMPHAGSDGQWLIRLSVGLEATADELAGDIYEALDVALA